MDKNKQLVSRLIDISRNQKQANEIHRDYESCEIYSIEKLLFWIKKRAGKTNQVSYDLCRNKHCKNEGNEFEHFFVMNFKNKTILQIVIMTILETSNVSMNDHVYVI